MKNKSVAIYTLGCRVNMYESCAIAQQLKSQGFDVKRGGNCDYYIVNTCAVTAESERKSRQLIRRCASKGKVLVIGCASQLNAKYSQIENVIYNCGNRDKASVVDVLIDDSQFKCDALQSMDGAPYENICIDGTDGLFSECRAFIKIQDGCNGKCTYCIIPTCRGKVRSRDPELVIEEARRLVKNGYKEIILTGIEVGAYNKIPLHELIQQVSHVEGLERIRLGSLSPNIITERFLQSISQIDKFMPHFHLSLQSCNDRILGLMKRPYRKSDIIERVRLIRQYVPNCLISADIIVGFPSETDEEFRETVECIKELSLFHVHSFPYSERSGTPAATMPNSIPRDVRNARNVQLLRECESKREEIFEAFLGKTLSVLIERIEDGIANGHSKEFAEVYFPAGNGVAVGDITEVLIDSYKSDRLCGTVD